MSVMKMWKLATLGAPHPAGFLPKQSEGYMACSLRVTWHAAQQVPGCMMRLVWHDAGKDYNQMKKIRMHTCYPALRKPVLWHARAVCIQRAASEECLCQQ